MSSARIPVLKLPGEGRTIGVLGDVYRFLTTSEDTDGKYATWEAVVPPGGGPPPHRHSREEESFYILEGEIAFYRGEERVVAGPGTFINMPKGSKHWFTNEGQTAAKMLITIAPAGMEQMLFEIGEPITLGATSAPPATKERIDKLVRIAADYGIEVSLPSQT